MDIKELQRFARIENNRLRKLFNISEKSQFEILKHTVKLSEEVGELSEQVLAYMSHQRNTKNKFNRTSFEYEFADVILSTLVLADSAGIDIEKSLIQKIEKINKRYKN